MTCKICKENKPAYEMSMYDLCFTCWTTVIPYDALLHKARELNTTTEQERQL